MFHLKKKFHYCAKIIISNEKTPNILVPTYIRLNNDIDFVETK
jgi:hypothetical protein